MSNTELVMTAVDIARLTKCEKIIEAGQKTFAEVANALMEIKEFKLYREDYKSFDQCCHERWGFTSRRADMMIEAAKVQKQEPLVLKNMSERAIRPLTGVPPRQVKKVVADAKKVADKENRPVKPADIKAAVKKHKQETVIMHDEVGRLIPQDLISLWQRREEVQVHINALARIKSAMKTAEDTKDTLYSTLHFQTFYTHLDAMSHDLKYAMPYAVCGLCNGAKCKVCKTGFMNKLSWDRNVPEEMKAIIKKGIIKK